MKFKYQVFIKNGHGTKHLYYGNDVAVAEKLFNDWSGLYVQVTLMENDRAVKEYFPL